MLPKNSTDAFKARSFTSLLTIICLFSLLNAGVSSLNDGLLASPIFLDSIFTIAAGILLGPLPGMATGLLTHIFLSIFTWGGIIYMYFAPCSMLTGLIIGLLNRKNKFKNGQNLMFTVMIIALVNTAVGALTTIIVFNGFTLSEIDHVTAALYDSRFPFYTAVLTSSLIANIIDKMISVYAAYGLILLIKGWNSKKAQG